MGYRKQKKRDKAREIRRGRRLVAGGDSNKNPETQQSETEEIKSMDSKHEMGTKQRFTRPVASIYSCKFLSLALYINISMILII